MSDQPPDRRPGNPFAPPSAPAQRLGKAAGGDSPVHQKVPPSMVWAACLWGVLALKLFTVAWLLRSLFEDQSGELPILTVWLLHPMATLLLFFVTAVVLVSMLVVETPPARDKTGRIALVLGAVATVICLIGLWWPVVSRASG